MEEYGEEVTGTPIRPKKKQYKDPLEGVYVPPTFEENEKCYEGVCSEAQDKPEVTSFVVKLADRSVVQFQTLESTLEGKSYVVIPRLYFDVRPEEMVVLDDCVLVPFIKQ